MGKEEKEKQFHVMEGTQPRFTGNKAGADAYASKLIADAIHQGRDYTNAEHAVTVVAA